MSNIFDIKRFSSSLQKSSSSSSSSSSSILQNFVRFHDYRVRYEFYTFTNKSSKSRIVSIDEKRKNMNWSFRDELKTKRKVMWRACIEFNIWVNIKINIFILSYRMLESKFVLTHSKNQIFYICLRKFLCICFSFRYSRVIM